MPTLPGEPLPLACVPGAIPAGERPAHRALTRRLFGSAAQEREILPDGYAFRFPVEALGDVASFIINERRCCPFLTFELTVPPESGQVELKLTGPEGTRALLESELPL